MKKTLVLALFTLLANTAQADFVSATSNLSWCLNQSSYYKPTGISQTQRVYYRAGVCHQEVTNVLREWCKDNGARSVDANVMCVTNAYNSEAQTQVILKLVESLMK